MEKNYTAITFAADDKKALKQFLSLPAKLYSRRELTQDRQTELALISGTHILNRYFMVFPILVTDESGRSAARCAVTIYPDREEAYFGFFESINNAEAAKAAMSLAEKIAAENGKPSITGPVDCSFWIRYRLKTDRFGEPYTGEPYNLPYYQRLLEECGLTVCEEYFSNHYGRIPLSDRNPKNEKRLADIKAKGYSVVTPEAEDMDRILGEVYDMLITLYSGFPTFSYISREDFTELFSPLKKAVDRSMIRMAYYKGEPAGFFVTVPDYGSSVCGELTPRKLIEIMRVKRKPKSYILLYLGAGRQHAGLGTALAESLKQELAHNGACSVGALIRKGKVSGGYFKNLVDSTYNYCLYSKSTASCAS